LTKSAAESLSCLSIGFCLVAAFDFVQDSSHVPPELWTSAAKMAGCGLAVAGCAVPAGLAALFFARRRGQPLLPRPRRWPVPWTGLELVLLFPFAAIAPLALIDPLLTASGFYSAVYGAEAPAEAWLPMRPLWSAVFFLPLFLGLVSFLRLSLYPDWKNAEPPRPASIAARIAIAVVAWLILHPIVAVIHFGVAICFAALDWPMVKHPLEEIAWGSRPDLDRVLLFVQASALTPVLEELLFRGMLLPWLFARSHRAGITMAVAMILAAALGIERAAGGDSTLAFGPVGFALFLLAGWAVFRLSRHRKSRTKSAIYASAALFALIHSNVWPTPIPLFVLGLGLGWLALRTRGILVPTIVHGLFNAVSVLAVLRG
jgi:membrane protease YdiL (CAAX protease family)